MTIITILILLVLSGYPGEFIDHNKTGILDSSYPLVPETQGIMIAPDAQPGMYESYIYILDTHSNNIQTARGIRVQVNVSSLPATRSAQAPQAWAAVAAILILALTLRTVVGSSRAASRNPHE